MFAQKSCLADRIVRLTVVISSFAFYSACGGGGSSSGGGNGGSQSFSISGSVASAFDGEPVPGVTVTLSGASAASTQSAADGRYTFGDLSSGNYTVSVQLAAALFTPEQQGVDLDGANISNVNFLALRGALLATGLEMLPETFVSSRQLHTSVSGSGDAVLFTDSSEFPLKRQPADGSPAVALAGRFRGAGSITVNGEDVYWIDGATLVKTAADGSTSIIATGRGEPGTAGLGGIVVDDTYAYWVDTNPQSTCSPSCTFDLQRIPLAGGQPETLATADREIVAIAGAATRIFWEELGSEPVEPGCNCGSKIKSVEKTGGAVLLLVDGTLNGVIPPPPPPLISGSWMPTGGLAVTATQIVFAAAGNDAYVLHTVPIQGGAVGTITSVDSSVGLSRNAVIDIRVDSQNAYWIEPGEGILMSVPLTGGTAAQLESALSNPGGLAIDGASAYWTEAGQTVGCCLRHGAGTVRRVPLGGGAVTTLQVGLDVPAEIAVNDENIHWTEEWRLGRADKNGGTAATLYSGIESDLPRIAVFGNDVYILDGAYIKVVPVDGGTVEKLASAHFGAADDIALISMAITADATSVYWTVKDVGGAPIVQKVPRSGGDAVQIGSDPVFASPTDCYWRIAVDSGHAYWSAGSVAYPIGCRVNRVPVDGGTVTTVVDQPYLADFAIDGQDLYFSEFEGSGSILRTPAGGGTQTPVADDVFAGVLADGGDHLYWIDFQLGSLARISKSPGTPTDAAQYWAIELVMDPLLAFESLTVAESGIYCTESQSGSVLAMF